MDQRLSAAPVVATFADAVRPIAGVRAFYVGGSLASGDYRPGISDLDLVAMVERDLDDDRQRRLTELHRRVGTDLLHCAYVPCDDVDGLDRDHLVWAHGELYRRPFGGIARAELHTFGITVYGPQPGDLFPSIDVATMKAAARAELAGYWTAAARKPELWLQDVYVDHGLTTLARARATITDGRLITKQAAIDSLHLLGVPPELIAEIRRRREGGTVTLSEDTRRSRGELSRRLMIERTAEILALP